MPSEIRCDVEPWSLVQVCDRSELHQQILHSHFESNDYVRFLFLITFMLFIFCSSCCKVQTVCAKHMCTNWRQRNEIRSECVVLWYLLSQLWTLTRRIRFEIVLWSCHSSNTYFVAVSTNLWCRKGLFLVNMAHKLMAHKSDIFNSPLIWRWMTLRLYIK